MNINAQEIGKKFGTEWIFKNFTYQFQQGKSYAAVGNNGSGKSTLLKTLAGMIPTNTGELHYQQNQRQIPAELFFKHLSFAAPYIELIEEFSLLEIIRFQAHFKPFLFSHQEIADRLGLTNPEKPIRFFSSGMKQKLKLALALYADCEILFLDEPTSNLDAANTDWFLREIVPLLSQRLIIIGSNQIHEYAFCDHIISLLDYKK